MGCKTMSGFWFHNGDSGGTACGIFQSHIHKWRQQALRYSEGLAKIKETMCMKCRGHGGLCGQASGQICLELHCGDCLVCGFGTNQPSFVKFLAKSRAQHMIGAFPVM